MPKKVEKVNKSQKSIKGSSEKDGGGILTLTLT